MERPKVGMGVIVVKDNKVLMGKRKSKHGQGTWCFPGGHLEFKEHFHECAARETLEETGVKIKNIRFVKLTNDFFPEKHYITIYMLADHDEGDPKTLEPDKFECWDWFDWDNLPEPLFVSMQNLLKTGYHP